MSRGIGWYEMFREFVPEWAVVVLGLVTQLGDVWFLGALLGVVYWVATERRDEAAAVLGLALTGLSLIAGLKHVFALPRPERVLAEVGALPEAIHPLYYATATATGYGFPSGHAMMTTIVYLSLAEYLAVGTRRQRYVGAAGLVTLVSFSRVGLGVHYVVDVVAGAGVGLAFLLVAWRLLDRYPSHRGTVGFALAVTVAGGALVTTDADPDAVLLAGASLGALAGWQLAVLARALDTGRGPIRTSRPLAARAVATVLALASLVAAIAAGWVDFTPLLTGSGALGLVVAAFVATPVLLRCDGGVRGLGRRAVAASR
ncbi:phosphatase PAP2 family protein [Natrinema salifodinae]|uniref:Membrane-associated phospholipid phosphatase n=1 Tax=Natrinema salifodinae TaxID=1202768 RepID=A0A1I0PME8_9EURY|nr:phosphatase PAP2 family protein [Natrinema salifodinae]SEW14988.1 Membrane-associated phospholipid phosphatase [Natrinema salifodinae]